MLIMYSINTDDEVYGPVNGNIDELTARDCVLHFMNNRFEISNDFPGYITLSNAQGTETQSFMVRIFYDALVIPGGWNEAQRS